MAVCVLVVIPNRQASKLLAKTFATGIVFTGLAIAISAPVAKALGNGLEFVVVGKHRAALTHRDVVGGVEAQRANVAKCTNHLATVGGAPGRRNSLQLATSCIFCTAPSPRPD